MALPLLVAVALSVAPVQAVRLHPGGQSVLKQPGVSRIAIGDPEVADVRVTGPGELLILGKHRGRTTLTLWTSAGPRALSVVIDDGEAEDLAKAVRDMVNPTLTVETFNDRKVIQGTVDSVDELHRLRALVAGDPRVTLLVRLDPAVLPFIARQITQALHHAGLTQAQALAVGGKILLEGSVTDSEERRKAQVIASAYYDAFLD